MKSPLGARYSLLCVLHEEMSKCFRYNSLMLPNTVRWCCAETVRQQIAGSVKINWRINDGMRRSERHSGTCKWPFRFPRFIVWGIRCTERWIFFDKCNSLTQRLAAMRNSCILSAESKAYLIVQARKKVWNSTEAKKSTHKLKCAPHIVLRLIWLELPKICFYFQFNNIGAEQVKHIRFTYSLLAPGKMMVGVAT